MKVRVEHHPHPQGWDEGFYALINAATGAIAYSVTPPGQHVGHRDLPVDAVVPDAQRGLRREADALKRFAAQVFRHGDHVFDKIGVKTGIDFFEIADAAEEVVAPAMPAECLLDRNALVMGYAGVYSSFLKHAVRQGERYGVPAHELLLRVGQRKLIGGQEDQLIDIALEIQRERAEGKA